MKIRYNRFGKEETTDINFWDIASAYIKLSMFMFGITFVSIIIIGFVFGLLFGIVGA